MIKTKQDRILNTFDEMFPDARCVLNHSNNLELLVAVCYQHKQQMKQ